jgi:protein-S-isoprenylcysteine O-methyltransferase Ste14
MTNSMRIANLLGYAGLLPFVVPALLVVGGSQYSDLCRSIAGTYAFGIIGFLAGSWWGRALSPGSGALLALSNGIFLLALLCFLLVPQWWALVAALLLFAMYLTERNTALLSDLGDGYRRLRRNLTLVAGCSMLALQIGG